MIRTMTMNSSIIEVTLEEKYSILTLNQPDTLNAFSKDMILALIEQIKKITSERNGKPLIITGKGRAFSSGGNLGVMKDFVDKGKNLEYIESIVPHVNELILLIRNYPGPTLAILNGSAVGGGFNVAMACDFRIANEKGKFRLGFIDIGLTPATGNSFFIAKTIGIAKALELSLFSEIITSTDLYTWGLVNELYTETSFSVIKNKWIEKITSLDPWQVIAVRNLFNDGVRNSLEQQLEEEYKTIKEASSRPLFKNRVIARWNEINSKKSSN